MLISLIKEQMTFSLYLSFIAQLVMTEGAIDHKKLKQNGYDFT